MSYVIKATGPDQTEYYCGAGRWSPDPDKAKRYSDPMAARRKIVEQERQFKVSVYERKVVPCE